MEEFEGTPVAKETRVKIGAIKNEADRYDSYAIDTAMHGTAELVLGVFSLKGSIDTGHQMVQHLVDAFNTASLTPFNTMDDISSGLLTLGTVLMALAARNAVMTVSYLIHNRQLTDQAGDLTTRLYQSYLDGVRTQSPQNTN